MFVMQDNTLCGSPPSSLYDQFVSPAPMDGVDLNSPYISLYGPSTVAAFYDSDGLFQGPLTSCSYSISELGLFERDLPYENHDRHNLQSSGNATASGHPGPPAPSQPLHSEESSVGYLHQIEQYEQHEQHVSLLPCVQHSLPAEPHETPPSATKYTFDPRTSNAQFSEADPHAADFLQERLGSRKWNVFSARLAERRLTASKSRSRSDSLSTPKSEVSATTIDFLVKVEVVKEVLRRFVPHPYNPLKYLIHPWPGSTNGTVILTRSTVLNLSGWSNTQFSYWARRSEAISVLGNFDDRLRTIGITLERRLKEDSSRDGTFEIQGFRPIFTLSEPDSTDAENSSLTITGKGLDAIIEEVKKRTGESQFLRGKHSSLDAYGARVIESESVEVAPAATSFQATFHPVEFTHHTPSAFQHRRDRRDSRTGVIARTRHSWDASYSTGPPFTTFDNRTDRVAAENVSTSLLSSPATVTFLPANSEIGPTRSSPRRRRLSLSTSPTIPKARLSASCSWVEDSI